MTRLKSQITGLVWKFTSPEDFRRAVCELFDQYANRAYRAGEVVQAERRALAYHAPPLVLRQLELELNRHIHENPEAALSAADALWKDAYLEPRLVAAFLLGQAPVDPPNAVLTRLEAWCQPKEDRQALDGVFERGTERLRREQDRHWLSLIHGWLNQNRPQYDSMAMRALLPAIRDRQFENFPPVYQLIGPLLPSNAVAVQNSLLEVLEALAHRSPTETAYFLRQALSLNPDPAILRMARRTLPALPENVRASLNATLKNI
jgi:hypothetical protein